MKYHFNSFTSILPYFLDTFSFPFHNIDKYLIHTLSSSQANGVEYDRVENVAFLKEVNLSSVLNTLRRRYQKNLVHTWAGEVLVITKPCLPLKVYSQKVYVVALLGLLLVLIVLFLCCWIYLFCVVEKLLCDFLKIFSS